MILVDSHVHFYDCFHEHQFLEYAYGNLQAASGLLGKKEFTGFLLLTEGAQQDWFSAIFSRSEKGRSPADQQVDYWTFQQTGDKCCLRANGPHGRRLWLVAGRQVVTAENLEVLAVFTDRRFEDGAPLIELIKELNQNGALAIIPWGTGKWFGKRGRFLKELIENNANLNFFLGDNSGRPNFWPQPSLFKLARRKGLQVLPGSDPLPFASEGKRAGSFGFALDGAVSDERPAEDLKSLLLNGQPLIPFGRLESPGRFFRNQIAMQVVKHLRNR